MRQTRRCANGPGRLVLAVAVCLASAPAVHGARHAFVGARLNGVAGVTGLLLAQQVAVSPDGVHVYVTSLEENEVIVFARSPTTGALSLVGKTGATTNNPRGVTVSPDGSHVYVAASSPGSIVVFARDGGTGLLTFVEAHNTTTVSELSAAVGVGVSPDGAHVYVASFGGDALVVFARDAGTGALTFVEAQQDGVGGVDGLDGAQSVVVSPDGAHAYATGGGGPIAMFSRDGGTGALTFLGTTTELGGQLAVSPDGAHVYTGSVRTFSRDAGTGLLTFLETQLVGGLKAAVSPDGAHVYTAGPGFFPANGILVTFTRDAATGLLTKSDTFVNGENAVDGLGGAQAVAVSPDSAHVYVAALEGAVAAFRRLRVGCSATAQAGCFVPAQAGAAKLVVQDNAVDARDKLVWKWVRGAAVTVGDLGDPVAGGTDYALCVYSSAGGAVLETELVVPAGGGCRRLSDGGSVACWKALAAPGLKYARRDRHPDGVSPVKLVAAAAGRSKALVKAKGPHLPLPALPLALPVTVQLQHADGQCWEATYSTATVNDASTFKAAAD